MKITVTGSSGFLGKHLVKKLAAMDSNHDIYAPSGQERNLCLNDDVEGLIEHNRKTDIVFHLAARVGGIGANRLHPGQFFHDNMLMGMNVIHQCMLHNVGKLIIVGTTCSYPKLAHIPFHESSLFDGYPEETNAPYGIAKRALLTMCQAYQQEYGLRFAYLIPTNLYGPGDNFNPETSHVIPALIKKCFDDKDKITVWGSGKATRDFLYVEDCVEALMLAMDKYDRPEPLNVGSGEEINIKMLLYLIRKAISHKGQIEWDSSKPDGQPRRKLNTRAIKDALGWQARTSLVEGLKETVEWYQSNM